MILVLVLDLEHSSSQIRRSLQAVTRKAALNAVALAKEACDSKTEAVLQGLLQFETTKTISVLRGSRLALCLFGRGP